MERYSFFNSVNKDRLYDAQDFTKYFSQFITNGIFPNPANALFVKSNGDNTLTLCNGQAWINGYMYELTEDGKVFTIDTDTRRTIQIVLRLDLINRNMKTYIKDGTDLERNDNIYELQLATIKIHNSIIEQSDITDTRLNSKVCGVVSLGLDHIDTSLIFEQFQSWFNQEKDRYNNSINEWVDEKKKAFDLWFDSIQDILKNNPVADLVGKFEKLRYDIFQLVEIYKHEIYESMAILEKRNRSNIKNEVAKLEFKLKASLIKIDNALKSLDETKDNAVKDINTAKDDFKKDMDKMKTQIKQDVDNTLSRVDGRINNIDNRVTNIEQKINSSLEVDISADKVKLNNSKFSSNNVDGALTELFTYADNGKKNWVDVIGSPLSNSDNFSTLKSKTQGLKTNFANKLTDKGIIANDHEDLNTLINKIDGLGQSKLFYPINSYGVFKEYNGYSVKSVGNGELYVIENTGLRLVNDIEKKVINESYYEGIVIFTGQYYVCAKNQDIKLYDKQGEKVKDHTIVTNVNNQNSIQIIDYDENYLYFIKSATSGANIFVEKFDYNLNFIESYQIGYEANYSSSTTSYGKGTINEYSLLDKEKILSYELQYTKQGNSEPYKDYKLNYSIYSIITKQKLLERKNINLDILQAKAVPNNITNRIIRKINNNYVWFIPFEDITGYDCIGNTLFEFKSNFDTE